LNIVYTKGCAELDTGGITLRLLTCNLKILSSNLAIMRRRD
jgi:hypothetical protein